MNWQDYFAKMNYTPPPESVVPQEQINRTNAGYKEITQSQPKAANMTTAQQKFAVSNFRPIKGVGALPAIAEKVVDYGVNNGYLQMPQNPSPMLSTAGQVLLQQPWQYWVKR